jgi:sulfoxide reductase heme-binding subunit YedZ
MPWLRQHWHRVLAHIAGLAPLVILAIDFLRGELAADPYRYATLHSGSAGLLLLVASLACTPVNILLGWRQAIQIRRTLGVYGFLYVALHLLSYAAFDSQFDAELIWRDLGERRSMLVGLLAFAALVPLALTSTNGWKRRLGKRWRLLHRLVYLALPLSVLHFFWLERDFILGPTIYAVVVGILLLLRLPPVRHAIVQARTRLMRPDTALTTPRHLNDQQ